MTASIRTLSSRFAPRAAAALLACGLTAVFTPVARAETAPDVPQVAVSYSDLDIATDKGARALYRRIVHAAREVCPAGEGSRIAKLDEIARSCIRDAVARAVHEVNSPRLAEVDATQSRRSKSG